MKKILFVAVAFAAISFASCSGCAGKLDEIQKAADSLEAVMESANSQIEEVDSVYGEAVDSIEAFAE